MQDKGALFGGEGEDIVLADDLERLLEAARPRLARLASGYGVAADGVEDVVQETFVNAWKQLEHLREPDRFEAWLNGICRNVSMRWTHAQATMDRRQRTFSSLEAVDEGESEIRVLDMADPTSVDLAEELTRQDLAVLLDRAMSYLSAPARQALELHYLADLPQREVALQLGLTINALEVKLHRARRQLRQVLESDLRADAASFGLAVEEGTANQGWRDTSVWCFVCGKRRLQGIYEPLSGDRFGLRMQCSACSIEAGSDMMNTGYTLSFTEKRSFRPAFKQVLQALSRFYKDALDTGYQQCPICNKMAVLCGIESVNWPAPIQARYATIIECSTCGKVPGSIFAHCAAYRPVAQFIQKYERCIAAKEELIEYEGQAAICTSLIDVMSAAQLTIILDCKTLELLAVL